MLWSLVLLACANSDRLEVPLPPAPPAVVAPAWPVAGSPLWLLAPRVPAGRHRVMIDPGHGAPNNEGNTGVLCQKEGEEMLRIGGRVMERLHRPGRLEVRSTRPEGRVTDYGSRIRWANSWSNLLISLHSDARGGVSWGVDPKTGCNRSEGASGFSVLWSDEGPADLVEQRKRLAQAVAARMIEAGFAAYGGEDYTGLYEGDPEHPGTFVDRHEPNQRIRMLRRPEVPSIIVETHNAPDPDDVARWQEEATLEAFAAALRAAIGDFVSPR